MTAFSFAQLILESETWPTKRCCEQPYGTNYRSFPLDHRNPELASSLYRIEPGAANYPHYHVAGADIFLIVEGKGELLTCVMAPPNDTVANTALKITPVTTGSFFHVSPQELHWIRNLSTDAPLYYLNIAPLNHEFDRIDVTVQA